MDNGIRRADLLHGFIKHIAAGDFDAAIRKLKEQTTLPAVCGRVCPQESQCEGKCVRGIKTEPVGIGRLERFVAEQHLTACVVEARDAARIFLAETAAATDYDLAEALDTAAEAADIAVSLAETLLAAPDAISLAHLPEDESWLDRRREQLDALGRCDERLRSAILAALDVAGEEHQMSNLPV